MYADPEVDAPLRREASIALQHAVLHLDGATHSVDYAAKLDEGSVAGTLAYAPVMHRDSRIDQIAAERPKPRQRAIFVGPSEPTVATTSAARIAAIFRVSVMQTALPEKLDQWKFMVHRAGCPSRCQHLQWVIGFDFGPSAQCLVMGQNPKYRIAEISTRATPTATEKPLGGSTPTRSNFHIKHKRAVVQRA
jgi:hypothetical protein